MLCMGTVSQPQHTSCLLLGFRENNRFLVLFHHNKQNCPIDCVIFAILFLFFLAQSDMDVGITAHRFSQQQAPPNQTAPWPDSMMPIDQAAFVNQNR